MRSPHHPFLLVALSPLAFLAAILTPADAGPLAAYEGFGEYAAGAQIESGSNGSAGTPVDGGLGWGGPYDVNNAIKSLVRAENRTSSPVVYTNGAISLHGGSRALRLYDIANGAYVLRRPLDKTFSAANGETLWFSFLFRSSNASPLANRDYLQLGFDDNPQAEGGTPRVGLGATTVEAIFPPDQPFRFFAKSTTDNANTAFADTDIVAGTTYLLVGRVTASTTTTYDTVALFLNPTSISDPGAASATIAVDSGLSALTHLFLRTSGLDNGDAYVFDEIRLGQTYPSVVAPPPFDLEITPGSLRWSALHANTCLETSDSLAPASWLPVPGPFPLDGTDFTYPLPFIEAPDRAFFRLVRP